jgi:hypothetical protein
MKRRYPAQATAVFKKQIYQRQGGCCHHHRRLKGGAVASAPAVARSLSPQPSEKARSRRASFG